MFYNMIKPAEGELEDEDDSGDEDAPQKEDPSTKKISGVQNYPQKKLSEKAAKIQGKIKSVAKMLIMQKVLREQSEQIINIKSANNNKLPKGLLMEGSDGKLPLRQPYMHSKTPSLLT